LIEWINFISLVISIFLFCYLYTLSLQPKKRSEKRGEKAWKEAAIYRSVSGFLELVILFNMILWIWFPISQLNWKVSDNFLIGVFIGVAILIPGIILMIKGMLDAGSETLKPSENTEMYSGIYEYIRHPQSLGEFPTFIGVAFMVNSWFLVIIMLLFNIIYAPIMVYFEEKDLIRRYGKDYKEYQKKTGAFFPKLRKGGNEND
jgi:protein-S-isoprenylcysteine O-methyltransferase Ste14